MIGRGLDGSGLQVFTLLSSNDFDGAGCSNPVDLSAYQQATLIVNAGSIETAAEFVMQRSATSDGTFAQFGASIPFSTGSYVAMRSFGANTSAFWHRLYYTNGTGSATVGAILLAQGARFVPVNQPTNDGASVYSFVAAAR